MKLLINCSTLSATGVTQVAISFINECRIFHENDYHILLSKTVSREIDKSQFPSNFSFYLIDNHPLYGLNGFKMRKKIRKLEDQIVPEIVFSVFGPSWWTPKAPHLIGFAYPYIVYPNSPYFSTLSIIEGLKTNIQKLIHILFLKRNGNYFVSETDDVSNRIINILKIKTENSYVATNTCSSLFSEEVNGGLKILAPKKENEFRFLSLCSLSPHKNLEILNHVIPLINNLNLNLNLKFILTVGEDVYEKSFTDIAKKSIHNIGRIEVTKCPQLYKECDALFLPTLLECSSANFPEAMKMKIPIVTSNLPFATAVCKDSALYFDPMDPVNISRTIKLLIENPLIQKKLIEKGTKRLDYFLTANGRAKKYLNICEEIIEKEKFISK
jgi:glycosyltransferase involved in cell wall biosynthesis